MSRSTVRFFAALAVVAMPALAEAQVCSNGSVVTATCPIAATLNLTIPKIVYLDLGTATVTIATPTFNVDALETPKDTVTTVQFTAKGNIGFTVSLLAGAASFTGPAVRAASTLEVSSGACAVFSALSNVTPATVLTEAAATNGAAPTNLCFRINFPADYEDVANTPGAYSLGVTLTITSA